MLDDIIIKKLQIIFIINKNTYYDVSKKNIIDKIIKNISYNKLQIFIDYIFKNINNKYYKDIFEKKIKNFTIPINIDLEKININDNLDIINSEFEKQINYKLNNFFNNIFLNNLTNYESFNINEKNDVIIDLISKIKNENDIKLLKKVINIKEFYDSLLKDSDKVKDFWIKVGQNDNSIDYILNNISNVNILKTINTIYNIDLNLINQLKKEIYEYKDLLFINKIKLEEIENIIFKELLKTYPFKNFNIYEFTTILIEKFLKLNGENIYNFSEKVLKNKFIFNKKNIKLIKLLQII